MLAFVSTLVSFLRRSVRKFNSLISFPHPAFLDWVLMVSMSYFCNIGFSVFLQGLHGCSSTDGAKLKRL